MLARAPASEELAALLGVERVARLSGQLASRARSWAVGAFGAASVTVVPGDAIRDLGSTLANAFASGRDGDPVIAVAPELGTWRPDLATEALDDLAAGCALTLGPIFDGGFYLLGLARPLPALSEASAFGHAGRDPLAGLLALAERERLEVGLLRTERGLRRAADVRALLADPLTDGELRGLLE